MWFQKWEHAGKPSQLTNLNLTQGISFLFQTLLYKVLDVVHFAKLVHTVGRTLFWKKSKVTDSCSNSNSMDVRIRPELKAWKWKYIQCYCSYYLKHVWVEEMAVLNIFIVSIGDLFNINPCITVRYAGLQYSWQKYIKNQTKSDLSIVCL